MFPNHSNDLHTFWASQNHEWTYCYPLGKGNINYFMGGILKHTLILLNSLPNVKLEVKQKIEYRFPKSHLSTFNTVTPNLSRNEYLWFISGTSRFWWGWKFSNKKKKKGSREEFKKIETNTSLTKLLYSLNLGLNWGQVSIIIFSKQINICIKICDVI